jgi:GDP-4-dehydro-6-deoxy-D-mannose reductase
VVAGFEASGHRVTGTSTAGGDGLIALDLGGAPARFEQVLDQARPDTVVHLAGIQSVPDSWSDPARVFRANTGGTAALLRALEHSAPRSHLILASTAAVYGEPGPGGEGATAPFDEDDPVGPGSPYAASKAAAELLAGECAVRTGLAVTIARLFNQFGPDQPTSQVPAGFAETIAAAEIAGGRSVSLEVGNPDARRDYTDTRDTARALRLVAENRVTGCFNFCSGGTLSLAELVEGLAAAANVDVGIEHRPERANRNDVEEFAGSPARLEAATGWRPQIPARQSLAEMLEFRRGQLPDG